MKETKIAYIETIIIFDFVVTSTYSSNLLDCDYVLLLNCCVVIFFYCCLPKSQLCEFFLVAVVVWGCGDDVGCSLCLHRKRRRFHNQDALEAGPYHHVRWVSAACCCASSRRQHRGHLWRGVRRPCRM